MPGYIFGTDKIFVDDTWTSHIQRILDRWFAESFVYKLELYESIAFYIYIIIIKKM